VRRFDARTRHRLIPLLSADIYATPSKTSHLKGAGRRPLGHAIIPRVVRHRILFDGDIGPTEGRVRILAGNVLLVKTLLPDASV
jgi:hypothetical protein